jgi:agmatine deiminase
MSATLRSRPARDGFRMPAEFAAHDGCWMLWPERPDNWRLGAKPAQHAFAAVAATIVRGERVSVGVSARQYANARALLPAAVRVVELSSNDAWMRDVGPTFVVDRRGRRRGVDWRFNAWGGHAHGLYSPWDLDDAVAGKVCEIESVDRYRAPFILEGGSIHVDGQGTLLTTEECLLNPNRNPALSRGRIERLLADFLGVEVVVWLGRGVHADETDGHIDNLCCFSAPGEVCLTWSDDRRDPQYRISREAYERLAVARDARGRRLRIRKLVQPGPLYMTAEEARGIDATDGAEPRRSGARLAGSYVNYYVANRRVVMPLLDPRRDAAAAALLKDAFPSREIVGVQAREILLGGGNIHCITQQLPRPLRLRRAERRGRRAA